MDADLDGTEILAVSRSPLAAISGRPVCE